MKTHRLKGETYSGHNITSWLLRCILDLKLAAVRLPALNKVYFKKEMFYLLVCLVCSWHLPPNLIAGVQHFGWSEQ